MLVISALAGVIYVFLTGKGGSSNQVQPAPGTQSSPLPKPVVPAANAPEGVAMESLDTPVKAGENSSVTVRTNAGSDCTIVVTYAGGVKASDSGLAAKKADAYGFVTWSWTVEPSVPVGKYPIKVTCVFHGRSGVVVGNLEVTNA